MQQVIILDKATKHFTRFVDLLSKQPELKLIDIKNVIPRASYYSIVVRKLLQLNKILKEIHPDLYLAEPTFSVTRSNDVFTCVKRCELLEIESRQGYFLIRCKNATKNKNNSTPCDAGAARAHQE